ncbi:MAG: cyclic nucleotide-binding domain-containing protein, partial [Dehalococcoidia bacterium]
MTSTGRITVESLRAVPIFSGCSPEGLYAIASSLESVEAGIGEVIFREGDSGEEMYIIASGQLRVVSDVQTEKVVYAHLGPGEFFGEMALITGAPRSAGVIATTDVRLWRLSKAQFDLIQKEHPEVNAEINRILGERVERGNAHRFQNEAFTLLSLTPERREITIGRLPQNDLVLNDPQVEAVHARIRDMEGRWVIYDEDTAIGTYVNRRRIRVAELHDGDEI